MRVVILLILALCAAAFEFEDNLSALDVLEALLAEKRPKTPMCPSSPPQLCKKRCSRKKMKCKKGKCLMRQGSCCKFQCEEERRTGFCCHAMNATCEACKERKTIEEYCEDNPRTRGCEKESENPCENLRCGASCGSPGHLTVMRYCQPDGTCGMNAEPKCEPTCADEGWGCPDGYSCMRPRGKSMVKRCVGPADDIVDRIPDTDRETCVKKCKKKHTVRDGKGQMLLYKCLKGCSKKYSCATLPCGARCTPICPPFKVCATVEQFCQPDGTCGMSSQPLCKTKPICRSYFDCRECIMNGCQYTPMPFFGGRRSLKSVVTRPEGICSTKRKPLPDLFGRRAMTRFAMPEAIVDVNQCPEPINVIGRM